MTKKKEIYERLKNNPKNIRFEELCKAAKFFGFKFRGEKGSHRVCVREGVRESEFSECKGQGKTLSGKAIFKSD